jgi:hypothetical protein
MLPTIPDAVVVEDTGDETDITFAPEHLDEVAQILRLRRKRQLTPAQRRAVAAQLAKVRPKPLSGASVSRQIPPIAPPAGENPG